MILSEYYEKMYDTFSKNNQVTLVQKAKELELFENVRFHNFKRFGNSIAGIWFGPLLLQISLEMNYLKFYYNPVFKIEVFDYFDKSWNEYSVSSMLKGPIFEENADFTWIYSPHNENPIFREYLDYHAILSNRKAFLTIDTKDKVQGIVEDTNIILEFDKPISIVDMVKQISVLSGHAYDNEERLRVLYLFYIYFKKIDKAKEVLTEWNSEKRWMFFDPREKELLENPDIYIDYVNEIKKKRKHSKLNEIVVND